MIRLVIALCIRRSGPHTFVQEMGFMILPANNTCRPLESDTPLWWKWSSDRESLHEITLGRHTASLRMVLASVCTLIPLPSKSVRWWVWIAMFSCLKASPVTCNTFDLCLLQSLGALIWLRRNRSCINTDSPWSFLPHKDSRFYTYYNRFPREMCTQQAMRPSPAWLPAISPSV